MSWNNKRHLHWILPKYEICEKGCKGRPLGTENAYNREALFEIFKNARKICGDRPLACNILHAINDYARVVNDALEAGANIIVTGGWTSAGTSKACKKIIQTWRLFR